jgi:hypothetical protein
MNLKVFKNSNLPLGWVSALSSLSRTLVCGCFHLVVLGKAKEVVEASRVRAVAAVAVVEMDV